MMSDKTAMQEELLTVRGLVSGFETDRGIIRAVDGVSFEIEKGKTTGVVGESGCGKTVTAMSIVDLLPKPSGQILYGSICLNGKELIGIESDQMHQQISRLSFAMIYHQSKQNYLRSQSSLHQQRP